MVTAEAEVEELRADSSGTSVAKATPAPGPYGTAESRALKQDKAPLALPVP